MGVGIADFCDTLGPGEAVQGIAMRQTCSRELRTAVLGARSASDRREVISAETAKGAIGFSVPKAAISS